MTQPDEIHSEFERRLHDQYREAAKELPPPALDKRILDAARSAAAVPVQRAPSAGAGAAAGSSARAGTDGRTEPGFGKFGEASVNDSGFTADRDDAPRARREEIRWGKPLALAAAVVLGIGIVTRVQLERPDLAPASDAPVVAEKSAPAPAPSPAAAPAPAAPAPSVTADAAGAKAEAPAVAADAVQKKAAAPEAEAAPRALAQRQQRADAPASRAGLDPAMREQLAKEETAAKMRESAASELRSMEAAKPAQGGAQGTVIASNNAPGALGSADAARARSAPPPAGAAAPAVPAAPAVAAAPAAPAAPAAAPAPPPPPAPIAAARPAPAPAPATAQAPAEPAAPRAESAAPAPFYEGDPDLWARRIVELRKAGSNVRADAELKRLRARYPAFKVPAEAVGAAQ